MVSDIFPQKPISFGKQVIMMKHYFPDFTCRWRKNIVTWIGKIQPSLLSQCYTIKICYQLYKSPQVNVLEPQLTERQGESIPHTYPGNRLCLYHPNKPEWNSQQYIAETIVPWASLWLFYYEIWQATGKWLGKGEHPILKKKNKKRSIVNQINCRESEVKKIKVSKIN